MSSSESAKDPFEEAQTRFLDSLYPEERLNVTPCATGKELLAALNEQVKFPESFKSWGKSILPQIRAFSERLQPYFEIVSIFVQCNPQYTAIVWGSLRLIFQLAINFTTFFEKLAKLLGRLGALLEFSRDTARLTRFSQSSSASRVRASLGEIYFGLFRFFQSIVRVFRKRNGTTKPTPLVIGSLVWKPFDVRFQDIVEVFTEHGQIIRNELLLLQSQNLQDFTGEAAKERLRRDEARAAIKVQLEQMKQCSVEFQKEMKEIDQVLHRILQWVNPSEFNSELCKCAELREEGTGIWIFDEARFKAWRYGELPAENKDRKKFGRNALWIQGNPGAGKSVLSASIVNRLSEDCNEEGCGEVFYFFFQTDATKMMEPLYALRAIAAQLLQSRRMEQHTLDKFLFVMEEQSGGQVTATSIELADILRSCFQEPGPIWMVIDGIDECKDINGLLKYLLPLSATASCKSLFLSRPNVHGLMKSTTNGIRLTVNKHSISQDIRIYVSRLLNELIDDEELFPQDNEVSSLVERLVYGADGMFLWARLMMSYLGSPMLTPERRIQAIVNVLLPEGLEQMYERILNMIAQGGPTQQTLARRIFAWLTYSATTLTVRQLHEAITIEEARDSENDHTSKYTNFTQTVIITCGGLVDHHFVDPINHQGETTFAFIHLSIFQFFQHLSKHWQRYEFGIIKATGEPLLQNRAQAHVHLAITCLRHLTYYFPAQPLSGKITHGVDHRMLAESFPFAVYSAQYWISHLQELIEPDADGMSKVTTCDYTEDLHVLLQTLSMFLSKPLVLMTWIEAFYTFSEKSRNRIPSRSLFEWCGWATYKIKSSPALSHYSSVCADLVDLSQELSALSQEWGVNLGNNPEIIWNEVTAFSKSRFFMETCSTTITSLVPEPFSQQSTKSLSTISGVNPDGSSMAVLSIWPPRSFEKLWYELDMQPSVISLREASKGWVARYEAWSLEIEPSHLFSIVIPLDPDEIWQLMCQALIRESSGWKMSFPLAISDDSRSFIILRTLYEIIDDGGTAPSKWRSTTIETDFSPYLDRAWSKRRDKWEFGCGSSTIYTYTFFFGLGNLLIFSDYECYHSSSLALFQIRKDDKLRAEAVKYVTNNGTEPPITKVAFHERHPLIVFCTDSIHVWNYDKNSVNFVKTAPFPIQSINISTCGKYAVLAGQRDTEVISLETFTANMSETLPEIKAETEHKVAGQDIRSFHFQPGQVVKNSVLINNGTEAISLLRADAVTLVHHNGKGKQQSIQIVALPKWPGISQTTPVVKLPSIVDPFLNIILNPDSRKWYKFSETDDKQLPLIIRRDPRVVKVPSGPGVLSLPMMPSQDENISRRLEY